MVAEKVFAEGVARIFEIFFRLNIGMQSFRRYRQTKIMVLSYLVFR